MEKLEIVIMGINHGKHVHTFYKDAKCKDVKNQKKKKEVQQWGICGVFGCYLNDIQVWLNDKTWLFTCYATCNL